jgi:transcriptional regulator with XRE-family HTH domain
MVSSPNNVNGDNGATVPRFVAFQRRLRQAMGVRGVTQTELARRMGTRQSTISDWLAEPGAKRTKLPSLEYVLQLPEALDVDGHWLLTGEGGMERAGDQEIGQRVRAEIERRVSELREELVADLGQRFGVGPEEEEGSTDPRASHAQGAAQIIAADRARRQRERDRSA